MKKIITTIGSILLLTIVSAKAEIGIGVSGAMHFISGDGTETTRTSNQKNTGSHDEEAVVPEIFIEAIGDKKPQVYFADNSRIDRPRVHKLTQEIDKVMRSRVLNPKWIDGMKKHGYKGAFEMGATLDYLFGYDACTGLVPNWCYSKITDTWLNDSANKDFLKLNNPWTLRDISERLLEAINRNMWTGATETQKELLKDLIFESEKTIESEIF